ncbi:hypothetical protein MJO28_000206 [Puccinia striiformis f. sp. tritici]|uniref:Uncharacterized protein n=1 Tax=Puccinia striiformis f. sp. tritici TaxID=168172 RepID=A0ACC0EXM4_9BASI|nr:hypothetical protein MJO28_000206 [Puccinia striiformis f. sp. tritici]
MANQSPLALEKTWQSVLLATASKAISDKLPELVETHTKRLTSIIFDRLIESKPESMLIFCAGSAIVIVHKIYSRKLALAERRIADAEQQKADAEQQKADAERRMADAERRMADAEQQKADAERRMADAEQQKADAEARYERWKDAEEQRMKRYERKIDDILLTQRFLDLKNQLNVMQSRTQKAPFTITPFI